MIGTCTMEDLKEMPTTAILIRGTGGEGVSYTIWTGRENIGAVWFGHGENPRTKRNPLQHGGWFIVTNQRRPQFFRTFHGACNEAERRIAAHLKGGAR